MFYGDIWWVRLEIASSSLYDLWKMIAPWGSWIRWSSPRSLYYTFSLKAPHRFEDTPTFSRETLANRFLVLVTEVIFLSPAMEHRLSNTTVFMRSRKSRCVYAVRNSMPYLEVRIRRRWIAPPLPPMGMSNAGKFRHMICQMPFKYYYLFKLLLV